MIAPRLTWTDLAAILLVLSFVVFEVTYLGLPIHEAAINAVAIVAAVVLLVLTPKSLTQLLRGLQELNSLLAGLPTVSATYTGTGTVGAPPAPGNGSPADTGAQS